MKRITAIFALALCLMLAAAASSALRPSEAEAATAAQSGLAADTIAVTGTASIEIKPDTATLSTGVMTEHKNAKTAAGENAKIMDAVVAALKKAGIKDSEIKTVSYSVDPSYDYSSSKMQLTGYRVTNMVQITVTNPDKVGDILDAATGAGANQASSVQFGVKDTAALYQQALTKAMDNAKVSAATLAKAAGRELNIVVQVTEGATAQAYGYEYARSSAASMAMDAAAGTYISSGNAAVSATVSVVYSLK